MTKAEFDRALIGTWPSTSGWRANRREPNWGEFPDQVIPGLPLSQTSDGNYVASEVVPCVFLAAPHPQRHVTPSATEEILCGGPHKISQIRQALLLGLAYNLYRLRRPPDTEEVNKAAL